MSSALLLPKFSELLLLTRQALPCAEVFAAGPTLRGAASSRILQEGPMLCAGRWVSPGKPLVPHCEERPEAAHYRRDQDCKSNPLSIGLPGCAHWRRPGSITHGLWTQMKRQALLRDWTTADPGGCRLGLLVVINMCSGSPPRGWRSLQPNGLADPLRFPLRRSRATCPFR